MVAGEGRIRRLVRGPLGGFLLCLLLSGSAFAEPVVKQVADGVTLIQEVKGQPDDPVVYSALKVDMAKPGVKVRAALGGDTVIEDTPTKGREAVSSLVQRKGAFAAVNADFFPFTGDPLNMAVVDGEFVSEPWDGRAVFGLRRDGSPVFDRLSFAGELVSASGSSCELHGLNRARREDEVILYSQAFGANTRTEAPGIEVVLSGADLPLKVNKPITATVESIAVDAQSSPIPTGRLVLSAAGEAAEWAVANLHEEDSITIRPMIKSYSNTSWDDVQQAVGGAVWLVKDGAVYVDSVDEKVAASFSPTRHPRTGVGVTAKGELLLVTIDGRQSISRGMSLPEFAELMKSLGAVTAINLDGGGSSTLSIRGLVINSPSEGKERPVADMLCVTAPPPPTAASAIKFSTDELTVQSGSETPLTLLSAETGDPLGPDELAKAVWGSTGGIGLVDQNGVLRSIKANTGKVVAILGNQKAEIVVKVEPGPAAKLSAKLEKDATGATNRGQVTASVTDANGNIPKDARVAIRAVGAIPDFPDAQVDKGGKAVFGFTWDESVPAAKRSIVVTSGTLPAATLKP